MSCRSGFLEGESCGGEPKPMGDRNPLGEEVCVMERTGLPVVVVISLDNVGWDGDLGCGGIESRSESRSESGSA